MLTLLKRPLHILSNRLRRNLRPAERMKEKWTADFSRPERSCFDIKPEISHNAYLDNGSLFLGLRKKNRMAWIETADRVYVDQLIEARFRFDGQGGYCAAGVMFRIVEGGTYYLALFSSKGYFRVDAVTKNNPSPLVGWTEAPGLDGNGASLSIIAWGGHFIFLLNGRWIAEARDGSIPGGHLGLALVSYDEAASTGAEGGWANAEALYPPPGLPSSAVQEGYVCKAWLDFLSVDSRPAAVGAEYEKWRGSAEISAESRLRLAESYAALGRFGPAYDQILKAWEQRAAAARSVMATYTEMRARGELLFAARMALWMGQYETAEEHIDTYLSMEDGSSHDGDDGSGAFSQKAIILSAQGKHAELAKFLSGHIQRVSAKGNAPGLPSLYALLGHAFWNLQDYAAAADAWEEAFSLNADGGLYAASAADALEALGQNTRALRFRIDAANCFLRQGDSREMEALVPKLLAVGKKSWEAHALAGKWAFALGDFDRAETELSLSDKLRQAAQPKQEADPAACCLRGDLLNRRERPAEAVAFFSEAARLAPGCDLYRSRLEEARSRLGDAPPCPPAKASARPAKERKAPGKELGKTEGKRLGQSEPAAKKISAKPDAGKENAGPKKHRKARQPAK